jgi:hypothetical protein
LVIIVNTKAIALPNVVILSGLLLGIGGTLASAAETQRLEPATIGLGESAQLTIASDDRSAIDPPMVAGLEFVAVGQSQRVESINGVTHASTSVTYQVNPQQVGVFTIPGAMSGVQPVVLTVNRGAVASGGAAATPGLPSGGAAGRPAGPAASTADGSAFVRLRLPTHELYVGETIPVDIEVGTRDGAVASLNGPPTLNGDAFTLNKLSAKPQRAEELIDGAPFTVFTWHSTLAAVKPGTLSLTMETPLTVRIRAAARHDGGLLGDSGLDELFDDPNLQSFLGGTTEREITVSSRPTSFTVKALPPGDRPANFSGAVGHFTVSSDLSADKAVAGDPITLRMHVTGTGNFDRVNTRMLHDIEDFKTYAPTAAFQPADELGYRGEKTFEQPLIGTEPGSRSLPPLSFSWFDPTTGHYAEAHTPAFQVAITPLPTAAAAFGINATLPAASGAKPPAFKSRDSVGLYPDHPQSDRGSKSLLPHYYQPAYLIAPSALAFAWLGLGVWMRRRDLARSSSVGEHAQMLRTGPLLAQMDEAGAANNAALFFTAARLAVARALALKWHLTPDDVTLEQVDARLGEKAPASQLFKLADEARYSKVTLTAIDFKYWKQIVLGHVGSEATT